MSNLSDDERKRAWGYYKHADTLQHHRHNIFIVSQSIFFAVYIQDPFGVGLVVLVVGIIYSVFWLYLSERLSDGMEAISDKYLKTDKVYSNYLYGLNSKRKIYSGRKILNRFIPCLIIIAWIALPIVKLMKICILHSLK